MVRGFAGLWLAFLLSVLPAVADAQGPRGGGVVFSWVRTDGAESCPGRPELADDVTRRLGYDPFRAPYGQSLEGVVSRSGAGWRVTLYNRDAAGAMLGQRDIESEEAECATLGDAVALAMALAIDPGAALRAPPAESDAETDADPPPDEDAESEATGATVEVEPEAEGRTDAAPEEAVRMSLSAAGSYDLVPGLGAAARLSADGPILPELRWLGAVTFWPEQLASRGGATFGIGLTTFSLGLCAGTRLDWFRIDGCATIDAGAVHAVVYSPTPLAPGQRIYLSATALLRLAVRIFDPIWVGLYGGVAVPFIRHEYRVQGHPDVVFEPSAVAPVAGIELAVRFP